MLCGTDRTSHWGEQQLSDAFDTIVPPPEIHQHFLGLSESSAALGHLITETLPRSNKTVTLSNFCSYIAGELRQMSNFYPANTAGLAWATRNLFETNLTIRHILSSDEHLLQWLGQALRDEKDFIDGILSISDNSQNAAAKMRLQQRVAQLDGMAKKHGLEFSRPFRVADIAKKLGLLDEYNGLYKLFSKYVHPSSLLVNSWQKQTPGQDWTNIFLVKAQVYSGDAIRRIADSCDTPKGSRLLAYGSSKT